MPFLKLNTFTKVKQTSTLKDQPKTEGTSTTYGQNITITPSFRTEQAVSTKQSRSGDNAIDTSVRGPSNRSQSTIQPSVLAGTKMVPQDTVIRVTQQLSEIKSNTLGSVSSFSGIAKSNIALAAVSANTNTSVALEGSSLISQQPKASVLSLSTLTSLTKVVPSVADTVVVKGSMYKTKEEQKKALLESQKVDMLIAIKSTQSEHIDLNTLKVPEISVNFVYNFFEETEEDTEEQEDQAKDPLLLRKPIDVPRYAEISWNVIETTEPLTGTEKEMQKNRELRKNTFSTKKGVVSYNSSNFRDSADKMKKNTNNISKDGVSSTLVDVNEVEKGFSGISNPTIFSNTIAATVNTQTQKNVLSSLPVVVGGTATTKVSLSLVGPSPSKSGESFTSTRFMVK